MGCLSLFLRSRDRRKGRTPSSIASDTARTPVQSRNAPRVQLPAELVLYIFDLAAADSRSTACTLALLCSATRDRVRLFLYISPVLYTSRQVNLFIRTVYRNQHLAGLVRRLSLKGTREGEGRNPLSTRLPKVLEACQGLEELELTKFVVYTLADFAGANSLTHLTLASCVLSDRTTVSRYHPFYTPLPSLETLSLHQVQFDAPTAARFLHPHTFPQLVALELDGCRLVEDPSDLADLGPYEPVELADQLEVLHIPEGAEDGLQASPRRQMNQTDPFDVVGKCTSLRCLTLPVVALTAELLESLPVEHLTHLSVLPPPAGQADLLEPHLAAAHALSTSFLALSTSSASASPFFSSPLGSANPLSASYSSRPATPLALSPFSSPMPSPGLGGLRMPLSQLIQITLPSTWDLNGGTSVAASAFAANGEFAWAAKRIVRECERRMVEVRYFENTSRGQKQLSGRELKQEVERVRREGSVAA
ncbi:hypothetical protein JCM10213_004475 [Rhodosporidiobolus nylandii]